MGTYPDRVPAAIDGLTRSQLAAVTHPGGPLLVLGGAGTGKTRVLERRFAWLVEGGAPAESVLALTFSPGAASAMRACLEELVEPPYDELHVGTLGAVCERLLRDEAPEAGLDPDFATVSAADRVALLLDELGELTLRQHEIRGNPAPLLAGFVSRIDRLKDEMIGPDELVQLARRRCEQTAEGDDATRIAAAREPRVRRPLCRPRPTARRVRGAGRGRPRAA